MFQMGKSEETESSLEVAGGEREKGMQTDSQWVWDLFWGEVMSSEIRQ